MAPHQIWYDMVPTRSDEVLGQGASIGLRSGIVGEGMVASHCYISHTPNLFIVYVTLVWYGGMVPYHTGTYHTYIP